MLALAALGIFLPRQVQDTYEPKKKELGIRN